MVHAATTNAHARRPTSASTSSIATTSSTSRSRTPTVAITSPRSSSSMDCRERRCRLWWVDLRDSLWWFPLILCPLFLCSDGSAAWRLRNELTAEKLHPRGRVRIGEGAGRLPAHPRQERRAVQLVLQVEGHRRVHQHVFLVPRVLHAARRRLHQSAEVARGRQRLVARPGRLHQRLVAEVPSAQRRHAWRLVSCYFPFCYDDSFKLGKDSLSNDAGWDWVGRVHMLGHINNRVLLSAD